MKDISASENSAIPERGNKMIGFHHPNTQHNAMANELSDKQAILETVLKFSWAIDTKKPLSAYPGAFEEVFTEDFQFGLSREQVPAVLHSAFA